MDIENEIKEQILSNLKITDTNDNGMIETVHVAPIGEYYGSDENGNPMKENITKESLEKLADKLNQGDDILVDIDHQSELGDSTQAVGWFTKWIVDPLRGLFATLRLTKSGRELIENREYRYISPTFILDKDKHPIDMTSAAVTNTPAFKGFIAPILNSKPKDNTLMIEITEEKLMEMIDNCVMKHLDEIKSDVKNEMTDEDVHDEDVHDDENDTHDEIKVEENVEDEENVHEDEVIKLEALNKKPIASPITSSVDWKNLHGQAFIDYFNKHKNEMI